MRLGRIADVGASFVERIDNELPVGTYEGKERSAFVRAAIFLQEGFGPGVALGSITELEMRYDKVFGENGLNFFALDKLTEHFAPASPGRAEIDEDYLLFLRRLQASIAHDFLRGGFGVNGNDGSNGQEKKNSKRPHG
jgi:hypothetical protein